MPSPLSVIFLGTPDFAVPSLRALAADPAFAVTLVVTQQDKPAGRKKRITPPPVKEAAEELGIAVLQPEHVNSELPAYVRDRGMHPDFLVTVAYGHILSQDVLDLPVKVPLNLHGSVLPRWRGASPIEHAILAGDETTGVTIQVMVAELDAGPILSAYEEPLSMADTAQTVRQRLSTIGAELLVATLKNPLKPIPQPSEGVTFCHKLTREDAKTDRHALTAIEIDRKVRALNPWPGVECEIDGRTVKLIETSLDATQRSIPLSCADDTTLHVVKVQPPGKKEMFADEWRRGVR